MILDDILVYKRQEVMHLPLLKKTTLPATEYDFKQALLKQQLTVIAELKPRSPAAGSLSEDYQPLAQALKYQTGGASALSVLTDQNYFGGSYDDIRAIRSQITLPILCKDFIVDIKQIYLARQAGADACLLIVAALSDAELSQFNQEITQLGMISVVEVFNETELKRALKIQPEIIQINNRNLRDFTVNLGNAHKLCQHVPDNIVIISASGINTPEEVKQIPSRANAVLIGSALMKSPNPAQFIQQIIELRK